MKKLLPMGIRRGINLRSPWLWLGCGYAAIAVVMRLLPLTRDLHYEFAAITALAVSLLGGIAALLDRSADDSPSHGFYRHLRLGIALSMLPLAIALVASLFVHSCGLLDGIAWYLLLVPASALLTTVLSLGVRLLLLRWAPALFAFTAVWSASLVRGGYEAYFQPHIYLYVWQFGFYPGASWDPDMPITITLVLYRLAHIAIGCALATVLLRIAEARSAAEPKIRPSIIVSSGIAMLAVTLALFRADLGLVRTGAWLQEELGDAVETRYATIHYDASTTDSLSLWKAVNYTDFFVERHGDAIGLDRIDPITIYLYASPTEQERLTGTRSASFTKPWLRIIHQTFDRLDGTLSHELVHVLIQPHGDPLLGVSLSQGLLEGSAVALESAYDSEVLHRFARAAYEFNLAPPIDHVVSYAGFSSLRSSLSYMLAGSFSRWLIDAHGIEPYRQAFAWGGFESAYGKPLEELAAEYATFIQTLPAPEATMRTAMLYRYGGGSFFSQKCLRRIGHLNSEGFSALAGGDNAEAFEAFSESLEEGISYSARSGIILSLSAMGRHRQLLDSTGVYEADTASYPLLPYLIERGDAHWALGNPGRARVLYDSVRRLDLSRSLRLRSELRLYFMRSTGDSAAGDTAMGRAINDTLSDMMREYFTTSMRRPQRSNLLLHASRRASESTTAAILRLMYATTLAAELPVTAIETALPTVRLVGDATPTAAERVILAQLAAELADALLYARSIRPTIDRDPDAEVLWRWALGGWTGIEPPEPSFAGAGHAALLVDFRKFLQTSRM